MNGKQNNVKVRAQEILRRYAKLSTSMEGRLGFWRTRLPVKYMRKLSTSHPRKPKFTGCFSLLLSAAIC